MKIFQLIIACITFSFSLHSQDLILRHGERSLVIEPGRFVELIIPPPDGNMENCKSKQLLAKYISQSTDSITVQVTHFDEVAVDAKLGRTYSSMTYKEENKAPMIILAKAEIMRIKRLGKGSSKGRENTFIQTMGGVMIILGAGHLTAAPFLVEDKLEMGSIGIGEILVGAILMGAGGRKTYFTSAFCPGLRPDTPIWQIQ